MRFLGVPETDHAAVGFPGWRALGGDRDLHTVGVQCNHNAPGFKALEAPQNLARATI